MSSSLHLDWCSHAAAKYAIEHWHYSRRMPSGKLARVGVWEDGRFIGAVIFGYSATSGRWLGLPITSAAELVRVALTKHVASVSRIVRIAVTLLRHFCPGLRLLVSYADPLHGHHGGIYQALGWTYTGLSAGHVEPIINGKFVPGRTCNARWGTRSPSRLRAMGIVIDRLVPSAKHRYALPLDSEMRERIAPLARPYPRRQSLESETPAVPGGNEGVAIRPDGFTLEPRLADA